MVKLASSVPDVIVIGAQKSGTSTFYRNLVAVRSLVFTKQKEANVLIERRDQQAMVRKYSRLFQRQGYPMIDVSPKYAQRHTYGDVAEKIFKLNPGVKIVYIVRDPVERIKSQLHHNALRDRLHTGIGRELRQNSDYVLTSSYYYQIEPFLKLFSREQILVYPFEQMVADPKTFQEIFFSFTGVHETPVPFRAFNVSDNRFVVKYHDWFHRYFGYYYLIKGYHLFWRIVGVKPARVELEQDVMAGLFDALQDDISQFIKTFRIDTTAWKTYNRLMKNRP